jgi:perosamine synthetase
MNAALAEFGLEPWIALTDPDITQAELDAATATLSSPRLSQGPRVEAFEETFARYAGRKHAVAVSSGTAGLLLALKAFGIGEGDEVLAAAYSWRETAHAITLAGAAPVFVDIDYWGGVLVPCKARGAHHAGDQGDPCEQYEWASGAMECAARTCVPTRLDPARGLDRGDRLDLPGPYRRQLRGLRGVRLFATRALCCGEGGIVVTDDADIARNAAQFARHAPAERGSHSSAPVHPIRRQ